MPDEFAGNRARRRYERVKGPFGGRHLGLRKTHVLVHNLNLGGGFIDFTDELPEGSRLVLKIKLPQEGPITVHAETLYRHQAGLAVRFVDLDAETAARLARTVDELKGRRPAPGLVVSCEGQTQHGAE